MPKQRDLYYDGKWQNPHGGYVETLNPGTGKSLGPCAEANAEDMDSAIQSAHRAWKDWRKTKPLERAVLLRKVANVLRANAANLAMIDAANCGNPVREMIKNVMFAAMRIDFFAGRVSEVKGETIPMGDGAINFSLRDPYGVCGRMVAYGSERAGKRAAAIQSLLATAALNGLDPVAWLRETLEKLPTCLNSDIDSLLPLGAPVITRSTRRN